MEVTDCVAGILAIKWGTQKIEDYEYSMRDDVRFVFMMNGVTEIGECAFSHCENLEFMPIPETVTKIAKDAFWCCPSLSKIEVVEGNPVYDSRDKCNAIIETANDKIILGCSTTVIPASVRSIGEKAFSNCGKLTEIHLPDGLEEICEYAFYGCSSLERVVIPKSVTYIEPGAFGNCPNLKQIVVAEGNPVYDSRNDCNAIIETETGTLVVACSTTVIPDDVAEIGTNAYGLNASVESLFIPKSVGMILDIPKNVAKIIVDEDNPVYDSRNDCNAIIETETNTLVYGCNKSVIPEGVESIGDIAFAQTEIESIVIPDGVKSIGYEAFGNCFNLVEVTIPESVEFIDETAFDGCNDSLKILVPNGKAEYYGQMLGEGYCIVEEFWQEKLFDEEEILEIPNGVTQIPDGLFAPDNNLRELYIPASVTHIEDGALLNCGKLQKIVVDENNAVYESYDDKLLIERESSMIIRGCNDAEIPNYVEIIGIGAFYGCNEMRSVEIPDSVEAIRLMAFEGCANLSSIVVNKYNPVYDSRNGCNAIIVTKTNNLIVGCSSTVIPDDVMGIDYDAFSGRVGLKSVVIPEGVVDDLSGAFAGCTDLTSIVVAEENPIYDSRYGCNAIIETESDMLVAGCGATIIPDDVTLISECAFEKSGLSSIVIPASVTEIFPLAFNACEKLTSIEFKGETQLSYNAIFACHNLESIKIPVGTMEFYKACISPEYQDKLEEV